MQPGKQRVQQRRDLYHTKASWPYAVELLDGPLHDQLGKLAQPLACYQDQQGSW